MPKSKSQTPPPEIAYFSQQKKIFFRFLKEEMGIHPLLILLVGAIFFSLFSSILLDDIKYGFIFYTFLPVFLLLSLLSNRKRIDFLRLHFSRKAFFRIRFLENIIISAPFILVLTTYFIFTSVLVCFLLAFIFTFVRFKVIHLRPAPHVFAKHKFEWISFFRKSRIVVFLLMGLMLAGFAVHNTILILVSLILFSFISYFVYTENIENKIFVWMYANKTPGQFLLLKLKHLLAFFIVPFLLFSALIFVYGIPQYYLLIPLILLLGVASCMFTKYQYINYPFTRQFVQGVLLMICLSSISTPYYIPILLILLLRGLFGARKSLKPILR